MRIVCLISPPRSLPANLDDVLQTDLTLAPVLTSPHRMGISNVCLTMSPSGDLVVYKNKGRPNAEEKTIMKCSEKLKKEIERLNEEMGYEPGTEVLLALSIASDQMIRHVDMFPEVFFMDVTANTNRQRRDVFLMVVRDASGQCYVGNMTVIPCGQAWIFSKIYQTFFVQLYCKKTIQRNRLALTDEDKAEIGPLECAIVTTDHWKKSSHMLCIFHAIVQAWHKQVVPLLPSKRSGNRRLLTERGKAYCEC